MTTVRSASEPQGVVGAALRKLAVGHWERLTWGLLVVSSAVYFLGDNEADNDLWVHLLIGRQILGTGAVPRIDSLSYTAPASPWVDHEWLTQSVFAWLFVRAGDTGLWTFKLAIGLLTALALWRMVARCSQLTWLRGAVAVLALAVLARGFAVRPQVITYLGVAALLAWLDAHGDGHRRRPSEWKLLAGTALAFSIWVNAHGGFVVGLGVLGLLAILPPWRGARWRRSMLPTALAASCLNPYGPRLFEYIWHELHVPHPLSEWQAVALGEPAHLPFLLMFAVLVLTLPFAKLLRRCPWWATLLGIVALMAFRHQRHIPLFAVCAAAPLADQLDGAFGWLRKRNAFRLSAPAKETIALALVALAATQVVILTQRVQREGLHIFYDASDYPVGAVRLLRARGTTGNVALPLDWGSYVLWHAAPALKVSLDGRFATVYPRQVVEDNFAFFRHSDEPAATRLLDEYPTTLVLAPRGQPMPAQRRPGWNLLYADEVAVLYAAGEPRPALIAEAQRGRVPFP